MPTCFAGVARRIARSEHDAEDAVQDVRVECLTRTHAEILHPSSYLRVAVKHAARRRAERERNRALREREVAYISSTSCPGTTS
ncbi:MAG: hypothetical protein CMJ89_04790 [Planctomycetes bacterium]|nr:hypothetical protein [Planctomycetota bacterium]